ncbi:class I SAM-dependent methyltransferase [[Acholeplasma] multilocale]|uniref:class I SAM-dependent methyltransferase n=1 Tax=[Acholeplasma] multilocale TaxID=264638 RepID=UPI00068427FD|nr:class I SAM-dependent methyltransferase [[Acholeplasma] multilocale]
MEKNYYGSLCSKIYDLTKPPGTSIDGDIEFYTQTLMPLDGKILEAGIGNGRMSIPLLRKGMDLVGLDNSNEMLEMCKINSEHYNVECPLVLGDLRTFEIDEKFEAIIMPNGSFCLLETREDAIETLKNFKRHLSPTGNIYIDLIYPISFKPGEKHEFDYEIDTNEEIKLINFAKEIDWLEQKTFSTLNYHQYSNGVETGFESQQFNLRWYGAEEFSLILKELGFTEISIVKNYNKASMLNLKTVTIIAK